MPTHITHDVSRFKTSVHMMQDSPPRRQTLQNQLLLFYEGHLESKERFAIKKYLLIIGKKKNMQVLSHTFTYFST